MAKRTLMSELGKSSTKGKAKADDEDADDEIEIGSDDADDDADEDEDDDDDESDDDEDDDDEELGPKGIKALRAERKKVRELTRQLAAATPPKKKAKSKSKDEDDDDEDDRSESDAKIARRELALKKSSAKAALLAAGASTKHADLLVGRIDFDDIDIDDDGDVDGLDDQVDELKDEYSEFFKSKKDDEDDDKPRRRRVPGSGDGARRGRTETKPKSSADRLADRLVGKG